MHRKSVLGQWQVMVFWNFNRGILSSKCADALGLRARDNNGSDNRIFLSLVKLFFIAGVYLG